MKDLGKNSFSARRSVLYVLAAGTLWGCMGILVRTMNGLGCGSMEVTTFRSLVTTCVMLVYMLLFRKNELKIKIKDVWCFLGTGLLSVVFFNVCYFSCMNYTGLSVAAILLYTAPTFVIVMSFFLFKEKFTAKKVAALVLAFSGCVLVSGGFGANSISLIGLLTGLGAGFGYALYSFFGKYALMRGYSSFTITTYTFLFAFIGTLPFIDVTHFCGAILSDAQMLLFDVFMAILTTVAAYILYTKGLSGLENGKASIIASIEPVVASIVGIVLYQEIPTPMGIAGMILVLLSCALVA